MKKKVALIFGITGQDGSYLAELLLKESFIDPSNNHELASRLCGARIIPIKIQDIK